MATNFAVWPAVIGLVREAAAALELRLERGDERVALVDRLHRELVRKPKRRGQCRRQSVCCHVCRPALVVRRILLRLPEHAATLTLSPNAVDMEISDNLRLSEPLLPIAPGASAPTSAEDPGADAEMRSVLHEVTEAFFQLLDEDIERINAFAASKLKELSASVEILEGIAAEHRRSHTRDSTTLGETSMSMQRFTQPCNVEEAIPVYCEGAKLRTYIHLNHEGVRKIVKKYDKVSRQPPRQKQVVKRLTSEPFVRDVLGRVNELIETIEDLFPGHVQQLRAAAKAGSAPPVAYPKWTPLLISVAIGLTVYFLPVISSRDGQDVDRQHRCFSLLTVVVLLWLTEALPYFATALLVPPLVVVAQVVPPHDDETVAMVSTRVLASMFGTPIILQVLAGLIAAAIVGRCQLELRIAVAMQRVLGSRPFAFLLALMMLGLLMSCLISNVTAPILLLAVMQPLLHDLPHGCRYSRALLLGIAFSCNLGGMLTPISAPQNAVSIAALQVFGLTIGFGEWMALSVPLAVVGAFISWGLILATLRPNDVTTIPEPPEPKGKLSVVQIIMLSMVFLTIALWATMSWPPFHNLFGDPAIVGLLLMVFAFGSGFLSKDEFNSVSWHLLALIAGGNTLGLAVKESGLLAHIAVSLTESLDTSSAYVLTLQLTAAVFLLSVAVSHTVCAIVIMPLVASIGVEVGYSCRLVILCALICSVTMALPMSSFPNVSALMAEDDVGAHYLSARDFLRPGTAASVAMYALVCTVGYMMAGHIIFDQPS